MLFSDFCNIVKAEYFGYASQGQYMQGLVKAAKILRDYSDDHLKSIYNGNKPFASNFKKQLPKPVDLGPLTTFFQTHLKDEHVGPLIDAIGVPSSIERKKDYVSAALAEQVKAFIESKTEDVPMVLAEAYNRQRITGIQSGYQIPQVLYAGDNVCVEPGGNKYDVGCYETIHHEWVIHNYGKAIWTGRSLVLANQAEIRPKFSLTKLDIPDVMPGGIIKIAVDISANGFEGSFNCKWEMQDSEGKNCFPNSRYDEKAIVISYCPLKNKFEVGYQATKKDPEWIYNISEVFTTTNITKLIINFTKKLAEYRTSKGEALSDEEQDLISENITVLSNLKQHTLPVFDIKANAEEEDVSEIFVRVNSGGVALKQNDFILTLLSLYWDEGRKEIEQFSMESTYPSKDKITSYNQLTEVTAQDVIRVVMAYAFDRARLKYGYKLLRGADFDKKGAVDETLRDQRFDVLKAKLPDVLNVHNWHEFLKSIMNAGYLSGDLILSGNAIYYTYAFYLIAKYRFNASYNENMHLTSLWFFYASMVSLYTGSFESTVENHLNSIKELTTLEEYKRFILSRVVERLTNDYFDITLIGSEGLAVSGRGNNAWNAYVAALNILNAKILFSKSNLLVSKLFEPGTDGKRKSLEKHHLFPKAYLKTLGYNDAKINQMANYAFIDWKDNMEILDEAPAIYYPVVCEGRSPEEIQRMEEENALPHGWENMSYEDFLIERRKLMATKIKQAFEILKNNAN